MHRDATWTAGRKLFRDLSEVSGLLAWVCDNDGYCVYLSPGWYSFTGVSDAEGINWINSVHPDDRIRTRQVFYEANDNQLEYQVTYRLLSSAGEYCLVSAHGVPHYNDAGEYLGLIGISKLVEEFARQTSELAPSQSTKTHLLTQRERQILGLFAKGHTAGSAGQTLGISEKTVVTHTYHATKKLGAVNKVDAVIKALRLNELEFPDSDT